MSVDPQLISKADAGQHRILDENAHILLLTGTIVAIGYVEEPIYTEIMDWPNMKLEGQNIS